MVKNSAVTGVGGIAINIGNHLFDLLIWLFGYFVHSSAYIDESCQIGAGTKIWHFSHVMAID